MRTVGGSRAREHVSRACGGDIVLLCPDVPQAAVHGFTCTKDSRAILESAEKFNRGSKIGKKEKLRC